MTSIQINEKKAGESKLNAELDNVLGTIADDLVIINSGKKGDLKILSLDDKIYARIMNLLKTTEDPVSKAKAKKEEEPEPIAKKPNIQDAVLKKIGQK